MTTLIFTSADSEIEKADLEGEGLAIHMVEQRRVEKAAYCKCQGDAPSAPGVADRQARGMEPEGAKQDQEGGHAQDAGLHADHQIFVVRIGGKRLVLDRRLIVVDPIEAARTGAEDGVARDDHEGAAIEPHPGTCTVCTGTVCSRAVLRSLNAEDDARHSLRQIRGDEKHTAERHDDQQDTRQPPFPRCRSKYQKKGEAKRNDIAGASYA